MKDVWDGGQLVLAVALLGEGGQEEVVDRFLIEVTKLKLKNLIKMNKYITH